MTQYDYTKSPCSVDRLQQEIQVSTITSSTLNHVEIFGDALSIFFDGDLSVDDKAILDTIVTNHGGTALPLDFIKVTATATTSVNSSSYVVLNGMTSPPLVAGQYLVFFRGNFSSNVPLLSNPAISISLFNNGVQVADSEMTEFTGNGGDLFDLVTVAQVMVGLNQKLDIRWKNNGVGNTMTCINRLMAIVRQK